MDISRFFQIAPNALLFKYAPLSFSTRYLRLLGRLYYIANRNERIQIERNIQEVFKNLDSTRDIVKKTFEGIFSHYSEKLIMAYKGLDQVKREIGASIDYSGIEFLDRALESGGVVLVTGHFGAVEFLPLALNRRSYPVSMVVTFQTAQLKQSLMARAAGGNVELIDAGMDGIFPRCIGALKRGRILLTECDEVDSWRPYHGRTVSAFGGEIKVDRTVEILCRRSGASVLAVFMVRNGTRYCMTVEPIDHGRLFTNLGQAEAVLKTFERFVMMFPDQWYQWKKFHRMRPEVV